MVKAYSRVGIVCLAAMAATGAVVALTGRLHQETPQIGVAGETALLPDVENLSIYFGEERALKRFAGEYPEQWTEIKLPPNSYTTDWQPFNSGTGSQGWKIRGFGCTGITLLKPEQLKEYFVDQLATPEWGLTDGKGTSMIAKEPTTSLNFSKELPGLPGAGPAFVSYRIEITKVPAFGAFSMYEVNRTFDHVPYGVDPRRR